MQSYSKDDIRQYLESCKANGITDSVRLYWLQSAMRIGIEKDVLELLKNPELAELQIFEIIAFSSCALPKQTVEKMGKDPKNISHYAEEHYRALYQPDREKIYQEIFDTFHAQWRQSYEQLIKQTGLLSETLEFLKSQICEKGLEIAQLQRSADAAMEKARREERRANNLEIEKAKWETFQETKTELGALQEENKEEKPKRKKVWNFSLLKSKSAENEMISLIKNLKDEQIEEILDGRERGLSIQDVKKYAKSEYSVKQMQEIKKILLKQRKEEA